MESLKILRKIITNQSLLKQSLNFSTKSFERPLILGIETSCDDTGAAIIDKNGTIFGEAINSQLEIHLRNGGIIPPIAQDLHRKNIENVVGQAFQQSGLSVEDVDAIAVTNRPGLNLSLVIGIRYAKHLARLHSKPIIPIHHMEAHATMPRINNEIPYPYLCLLASGGHCILTLVKSLDDFYILGQTLDDSPGEAFDKISRRLKLRNLPEFKDMSGGAAIEKAALRATNPDRFEFPLPLARLRDCQFSFSGIKNNCIRAIKKEEHELELSVDEVMPHYEDFCSGFLRASARHILHRTQRAIEFCEKRELLNTSSKKCLVFSGGCAANDFLFTALSQMAEQFGYQTFRPLKQHCTDNGLMIAWNGVERFLANKGIETNFDVIEALPKAKFGTDWRMEVSGESLACKWVKVPVMVNKT